jgi:hypothetical protein
MVRKGPALPPIFLAGYMIEGGTVDYLWITSSGYIYKY